MAKTNAEIQRAYYARNKAKCQARNTAWKEANREKMAFLRLRSHLRRTFNMEPEAYSALLAEQGGACRICRRPPAQKRRLEVDHSHSTGKIRGLLCGNCNRGLGLFQDSPTILRLAADYLRLLEV